MVEDPKDLAWRPRLRARACTDFGLAVPIPCYCHIHTVISRALAPVSGCGLRLKELLMPDLDQIKQGEQAGIPVTDAAPRPHALSRMFDAAQ